MRSGREKPVPERVRSTGREASARPLSTTVGDSQLLSLSFEIGQKNFGQFLAAEELRMFIPPLGRQLSPKGFDQDKPGEVVDCCTS